MPESFVLEEVWIEHKDGSRTESEIGRLSTHSLLKEFLEFPFAFDAQELVLVFGDGDSNKQLHLAYDEHEQIVLLESP